MKRVIYFSKEDLTCGSNLILAEPILRNYTKETYDINDIIELYQIKLYIDNDLYLNTWTENDISEFKKTTSLFWSLISKFWGKINDNNIEVFFNTLDSWYQNPFWSLFSTFNSYKHISEKSFIIILKNPHTWVREILHHKNIVNHYSEAIRQYLIDYEKSAELLLSQYEERKLVKGKDLHFPNSLTLNDKEQIILKYIDSPGVNLNYVRLIIKTRDTQILKLSPQTRLRATKVEREKNEEVLNSGPVFKYAAQVAFSEEQIEPIIEKWENNAQIVSYSTQYIDSNNDYFSLFHNFSSLFKFTDESGCITLISKMQELSVFEKILVHSKNEYSFGIIFTQKNNLSYLQILAYSNYLKYRNITLESILTEYIDKFLNQFFQMKDLIINLPSEGATPLEKIRMIAPEFEALLKQYTLFVSEGKIDHELLQISSAQIPFKEIPSSVNKKYVYAANERVQNLQYAFFSDQSLLFYVKPFENKYDNLFKLLINENVSLENFENYQRSTIDLLIKDGYLSVDSEGFIKLQKHIMISALGKLYYDEYISYWHLSQELRSVIDQMESEGMVYFRNTLFSEPESKYFNFFLNKSEFTNGFDLRNRYSHGTNKDDIEEHKCSYYLYLRLYVLALLKIEDDLIIKRSLLGDIK